MFASFLRKQRKYNYIQIQSLKMNTNGVHLNEKKNWIPHNIINLEISEEPENYAAIVLNTEILLNPKLVKNYWKKAQISVTVDGGTNRWLNFLRNYCQDDNIKYPDYIVGDFDSITSETIQYFEKSNCKIIHTPNQNETDFTKSLRLIETISEENNIKFILVFHENSGRLDHIMGNINTLFLAKSFLSNIKVYLINSESMTWLLEPGQHSIKIPKQLVEKNKCCGLIPIGRPCNVTTSGLKWNLNNQCTEFGTLVSTSNTYVSQAIEIETDGFLLWSMCIFSDI